MVEMTEPTTRLKDGRYMTEDEYRQWLVDNGVPGSKAMEIAGIEFGGPGDAILIADDGTELPAIALPREDDNAG